MEGIDINSPLMQIGVYSFLVKWCLIATPFMSLLGHYASHHLRLHGPSWLLVMNIPRALRRNETIAA